MERRDADVGQVAEHADVWVNAVEEAGGSSAP